MPLLNDEYIDVSQLDVNINCQKYPFVSSLLKRGMDVIVNRGNIGLVPQDRVNNSMLATARTNAKRIIGEVYSLWRESNGIAEPIGEALCDCCHKTVNLLPFSGDDTVTFDQRTRKVYQWTYYVCPHCDTCATRLADQAELSASAANGNANGGQTELNL